jgi:hypothetical protein
VAVILESMMTLRHFTRSLRQLAANSQRVLPAGSAQFAGARGDLRHTWNWRAMRKNNPLITYGYVIFFNADAVTGIASEGGALCPCLFIARYLG